MTTSPLRDETCDAPWMSWIGTKGPSTASAIVTAPARDCASVIEHGSDFEPGVVPGATVAVCVNVFEPPSVNAVAALSPIVDRSQVTARPVLAGSVPGVTATLSSVEPPPVTDDGLAEPVPEGFVPVGHCAAVVAELRGAGAPAAKSAPLLSVSVQPPFARKPAEVLERVGAALAPSKKFAPS